METVIHQRSYAQSIFPSLLGYGEPCCRVLGEGTAITSAAFADEAASLNKSLLPSEQIIHDLH
jgi:hypothetical protein